MRGFLLSLIAVGLVAACGSNEQQGDTDASDPHGETDNDTTDAAHDGVDSISDITDDPSDADVIDGCDRTIAEIIPGETHLEYSSAEDYPYWSVTSSITGTLDSPPVDYLQIWSNVAGGLHTRHGPSRPGIYDLSDYLIGDPSPGSNCDICVYLFEGCPPPPAFNSCERKYLATAGTLVIEQIELWSEGYITGLLSDAYLQEWDPLSGINPDGESICLDRWSISASISP